MSNHVLKTVGRFLALATAALLPVAALAQATAGATGTALSPPKWDIFAGYSALIPNGDICCYPAGHVFGYNSIDYGAILSITRYFNNYVGIRIEGDEHILLPETNITTSQPGDDFSGGYGGVVFRIPLSNGKVIPSFHVMAGAEQVGSIPQKDVFGFAFTAGGSLDVRTPAFDHHLSIRLFQADYQFVHANFAANQGGTYNFNPQGRLSAGLVWSIGMIAPPPPVTYSCSVSPSSGYPGDPITVTGTALNLNPKKTPTYTWNSSGGAISGTSTTANITTATAAPGTYTVTGHVTEGPKPGQSADCTAQFTINAFQPPTISCSASPSSVNSGDSSTITASAVSPQNRPLTYSYSATAGSVSGTGTSATLSTAGAAPGSIGVTCNVVDDKGNTATAHTSVNVIAPSAPPPALAPVASSLCAVNFSRDAKRPTRVDNEAKACLDDVATALQGKADAKLSLVGNEDAKEQAADAKQAKMKHPKPNASALRAVNTKDYLVTEKGIDASRIAVYTGTDDAQTVTTNLVPAGAADPAASSTPVDESAVKAVPRTR